MDTYVGRKQKPEFNLGLRKKVVLQLTKDLERSFSTVYFDNFFDRPKFIKQLFQKSIYGIETVRANRKQMPQMIHDKQMKSGDCKFLFSGNTMACKWMDNWSLLLLSSALEGMNDILSVQMREKGSKTKSSVPGPKIVKLYNSGMGGVYLMNQHTAACHLDRKSSLRFSLRIFFDLTDIECVNIYLICNMKHPNKLSLLDYKIVVSKNLTQYHQGCKRVVPISRSSKKSTNLNRLIIMEDIYQIIKGCENDARTVQWRVEKTFVICLACNVPIY